LANNINSQIYLFILKNYAFFKNLNDVVVFYRSLSPPYNHKQIIYKMQTTFYTTTHEFFLMLWLLPPLHGILYHLALLVGKGRAVVH
jgi:hypothetical protein